MFTQVDATITRRFGGTGLGLSISKQLAGMMGGNIGVKSELGKGSEFWVTVQLDLSSAWDVNRNGISAKLLLGVRVLLADGNLTSCKVMAEQLGFFGMRAEYEQNWSRAVEKLNQSLESGDPFLFMVADMDLQDMNPVDAVRKIREDPRMESLSIILLSSSKGIPNIAQPEKIGFSVCLNKPLAHLALPRAVSKILMEKAAVRLEEKEPGCAEASPCRDSSAIAGLVAALSQKGGRILLVEDIVTNQIVAMAMLKKFGLQVDAVSNGREALFALEKADYDLILMDLQMPEMDGYETTRQIRSPRSPVRNPQIPVIAMTAHVMQSDRDRCLDVGMNDFLSKPILIPVLAKILGKWLLSAGNKS
ncbi:MAG: Signal transduction histidine-protein kinase BarA [Lentisphaerae bacterium ADurb.Bin242]|nr:MAG: Signal transduction histidine-protein kinase BarA [Lentisphaerae bacterium ADurb.Bin242]